ncbi:MAG TPA: 5'-3' exonuclease H3TH domain-containing protein, partial [Fimbriimonadaceae bacterium]|nr:5'-3' exonuclease H3TH domain-containing protein [Fimbriimonadaceae bacterium]
LILTTDKDSYQLVSDRITVLSPKRGSRELDRIGPHQVVERLGVLPEQVPDFKALSGDSSDRIPGIRGIGPKGACALLLRHGSLEDVIAGWDPKEAELARMFREVVTMRPEVSVVLPDTAPDWAAGAEALRELGAGSLVDRLEALAV